MLTIWTTCLFAATVASGIFVVAGWRNSRDFRMISVKGGDAPITPSVGNQAEIDLASPHSQTDIGAATRLALQRLAPVISHRAIRAEVAMPPGMLVRMRGGLLADLLEDLVAAAIHAAPASRLLLTAAAHGNGIYVGVTDDMPGADLAVRLSSVRGLIERIALRGGTLDVDVRPAEGTTMTLRLSAVRDDWQENADMLDPANGTINSDKSH